MRRLLLVALVLLSCVGAAHATSGPATRQADVEAAMALPEELRQAFLAYSPPRARLNAEQRVQRLLDFMVAEDGLALRYQEQPTHGIAESYARREVNCLSFTMMYIALARASGLEAYAQATDSALEMRLWAGAAARATHVNAKVVIDGHGFEVDIGWRALVASRRMRQIEDAELVALLHNNNAVENLLLGETEAARKDIGAALSLDPGSATIWSNSGLIELRSGNRAAAEHAYLQALRFDRSHVGALGNIVGLYREIGDKALEEQYAKRLRRVQATDPFSQYLLGLQSSEKGEYAAAVAHYRRAIRLMSKQPMFYRGLAMAYRQKGELVASQRAERRAEELEARRNAHRSMREATSPGLGPGLSSN